MRSLTRARGFISLALDAPTVLRVTVGISVSFARTASLETLEPASVANAVFARETLI